MERTNWIEEIINFVLEAISKKLPVAGEKCCDGTYRFEVIKQIENTTENITIYLNEEYININTSGRGHIEKGIKLTERNKVDLDSLVLDINEYREKIALDRFYNFLTINMPPTLDNLDDDD